MFDLDELIDTAICEVSTSHANSINKSSEYHISEWEKFASELEDAAESESASESNSHKVNTDICRMHKLSMATILDVFDDPLVKPFIEKLSSDVDEIAKTAFESPNPGTIGDVARTESLNAQTFVKNKIGKGKTIFEKLKNNYIKEDK